MYVHVLWSTLCVLACDFFFFFIWEEKKGGGGEALWRRRKWKMREGESLMTDQLSLFPTEEWAFFFSIAFSLSLALCLLAWLDGSGGGGRSGRDPYFSKKIDAKRRRSREEKTGEGRRGEKPKREYMDGYPLYFGFTSTQYYFLLVPMDISTD